MLKHDLYLLVAQLSAETSARNVSSLGRELLTHLAARQGVSCHVDGWSPRGNGPPRHPGLPASLYPSLSHRDGRVVAGLATCPVGLDLEHLRERHRRRLAAMIDALPEPEVKHAIHASVAPLMAFYRAWSWYEALFKLETQHGARPANILATRLARLDDTDRYGWLWQADGWTLALTASTAQLAIHTLPYLRLHQYRRARDGLALNAE
ncbi:4'-phosphopantetheinyl transferase family protein [Aidingimonas lacisalsi]|uniref:4-phosphopantetheinyl transferase n=1 Tax=Aidingimonas lacisalsi TaxID=2604086 RepID=UPI0011D18323|nr:4-phosphopantetheinyl transferase [Aidingimonas lacisalsi]